MIIAVFVAQTMQVGKLLYFLNGLSAATSDAPAVAKAELMTNVSGITSYFDKLSGPEVCSNINVW